MKKFFALFLTLLLAAALALPAGAETLPDGSQGASYDPDLTEEGVPVPTPAPVEEPGVQSETARDPAADLADPGHGWSAPVDEQGRFLTPEGLYGTWQREGWPETVGGMWSLDGSMDRMAVAVVDGDETVMAEIRAMMADPDSLEFTACKYSYAQLERVAEEIAVLIKEDHIKCILGVGTALRGNDFSVNGQPCVQVLVSTLEEDGEAWAQTLADRYGDMVELEVGELAVRMDELGRPGVDIGGNGLEIGDTTTVGIGQGPAAPAAQWYLWLLPLAAAGLVGLAMVQRRQAAVARTADGRTVAAGSRMSRAQAENAVREATEAPGGALWDELKQKLER